MKEKYFVAALLFVFASFGAPQTTHAVAQPAEDLINVVRADQLEIMNTLDPVSARALFDRSNSYAFGIDASTTASAEALKTEGWQFQLTANYFSFAAFEADIIAGTIDPRVTTVGYDNEDGATPASETGSGGFDDPVSRRHATREFYTLAKQHGYTVILAPGTLCNASHVLSGGVFTPAECYSYLEDIAPYVDILDPQFQGLINKPDVHFALVTQSAALIRAANPTVKLLIEFTTNPTRNFTALQNISAMQAGLPFGDGLWAYLDPTPFGVQQGIDVWSALTSAEPDQARAADLVLLQRAVEAYRAAHGTYVVANSGWNNTGTGWMAREGNGKYYTAVTRALYNEGFLPRPLFDDQNSTSTNYMYYTCNSGQTYALFATLENASAADLANAQAACTGATLTANYGKNYALSGGI